MDSLIEMARLLGKVRGLALAGEAGKEIDDLTTRMGLLLLDVGQEVNRLRIESLTGRQAG
jgi:hypothetical protein